MQPSIIDQRLIIEKNCKILGTEYTTDFNVIRKHYYKFARIHHTDKGGDIEKFKEGNEAYQVLQEMFGPKG